MRCLRNSIHNVCDVSAWFSQQLGVAGQHHSAVRAAIMEQLLSELPPGAAADTPLRQLLPDIQLLRLYRHALRNRYGLVLPPLAASPVMPVTPSLWERLTGQYLPRVPHWYTQILAALIDWAVAFNYEKLLLPTFTSQYEIEQVVIGLTSDKSGVLIEEIRLASSFTNDLGMD